jgi:hypothetical protein
MPPARHLLIALTCALSALLIGCASVGAPLPPSLELIKPPSDLHAVRKGDHVYLSWTIPTHTIDRQSVRHRGPTLICRSLEAAMAECGTPAGSVAPEQIQSTSTASNVRQQATFVDTLPPDLLQPASTRSVTYAVEALNTSSRAAGLSNAVQVPLTPTIAPPSDFKAELAPNGIRLSWTGELLSLPMSPVNYYYRAYRRLQGTGERTVVGQVARGFDARPTVLDQTFAWEKHYDYWLNVVTDVRTGSHPCPDDNTRLLPCFDHVEIEGDDTPVQSVFTHDIYPPAVPTGVQAVFSGPGQQPFIDVLWAPDTDADLAGYNIYRHTEGAASEKVNADLVKTPSYRDKDVVSGKKYFYSVSAVDLRGNESARSEEASEQVP